MGKQKPSLKLIPCICTVVSMDITDMLGTHTPMDTMDTMESVKLRQSLKLILCICTVASMDITDMLDTHTPMVTTDTLESVKQKPSLKLILCICTVASMDITDMLDTHTPMDTMDTWDRYPHHQMNRHRNWTQMLSSSVTSIFQCLTLIQGLGAGNMEDLYFYNCNNKLSSAF